jgi:hypothetical protein
VNFPRSTNPPSPLPPTPADVQEGGETAFPHGKWLDKGLQAQPPYTECASTGVAVKPRKGDATLFYSLRLDGGWQGGWVLVGWAGRWQGGCLGLDGEWLSGWVSGCLRGVNEVGVRAHLCAEKAKKGRRKERGQWVWLEAAASQLCDSFPPVLCLTSGFSRCSLFSLPNQEQ